MKRLILFVCLIAGSMWQLASAKLQYVDLTSHVNSEYTLWKQGSSTNNANESCYASSNSTTRQDGTTLKNVIASSDVVKLEVSGLKSGYYAVTLNVRGTDIDDETTSMRSNVIVNTDKGDKTDMSTKLTNKMEKVKVVGFASNGSFTLFLKKSWSGSFEVQLYSVEAYTDDEMSVFDYTYQDLTPTLPTSYTAWEGALGACNLDPLIERSDKTYADLSEKWSWGGYKKGTLMSNVLTEDAPYGLYFIELYVGSSTSDKTTSFTENQRDVCYVKVENGERSFVNYIPLTRATQVGGCLQTAKLMIAADGGPLKVSLCADEDGTVWHLIQYYSVWAMVTNAYSNIEMTEADENLSDRQYYTPSGMRIPYLQRGLNIIRNGNGKAIKVLTR